MNKIDDILEQLKGQQPTIDDPDALTDRIMNSLPDLDEKASHPKARIEMRSLWAMLSTAACIAVALMFVWPNHSSELQAPSPLRNPSLRTASPNGTDSESAPYGLKVRSEHTIAQQVEASKNERHIVSANSSNHGSVSSGESNSYNRNDYLPLPAPVSEAQIHNAAMVTTADTLPYQDPARMDEFIAKMADFNNVKAVPLDCSPDSCDNTIVSTAYVFDDKEDFDLFARLLQAACWYDSKTPGYLLSYTHQQIYFTLKDLRKKEKHLWIAERVVGGHILLFSTHSPIEADISSACYQKYREQLTHTNFSTLQF